jgi:hypothetical protein
MNQNIRFGGLKRNLKQDLKVQKGMSPDTPALIGLQHDPQVIARMMAPSQNVASMRPNVFQMGEGCFANVSACPETVSISQISESLSALDHVSISAPYTGIRRLQHAMMDIDNAVFCLSATQLALQPEMTETKLIRPSFQNYFNSTKTWIKHPCRRQRH